MSQQNIQEEVVKCQTFLLVANVEYHSNYYFLVLYLYLNVMLVITDIIYFFVITHFPHKYNMVLFYGKSVRP